MVRWAGLIVVVGSLAVSLPTTQSVAQTVAQTPTPSVVAAAEIIPAASENARDTLRRASPAVVQIKGFFGTNTAKAFHGTGFAVAPGGIFMTNYHVVSEHVQDPARESAFKRRLGLGP